ncbi:MAG: DNA-directed RNA polymerase subunit beta [Candidatus Izimaplasma sp.]|nr:DNA-directed RNA polymerase subunit beta [Candidatus Izimaplasma bacterium]
MSYKMVKYGKKRERRNYSRVKSNIDLPDLIRVQTESFQWFIENGLEELFEDLSPIQNFTENIELYFEDPVLGEGKFSIYDAKHQDKTYSKPLRTNVKLVNKDTGEIKEQRIFMGDFPMMSPRGSFIINGSERVIVSQIVRSAGVFFSENIDKKTLRSKYVGQVIPTRGAWLELEMGSRRVLYSKLDRSKKIPLTTLLRALGFSSNDQIVELFGESDELDNTFAKDKTENSHEAIKEVYSKLRQGENATIEGAIEFLEGRLFDPRRYDLAPVGRYQLNKKLDLLERVKGKKLANDLVDPTTGEIIVEKNTLVTKKIANVLKDYRELFTQTIPGVGSRTINFDFEVQTELFRSAEFEGFKLFDYLSDEELLEDIRTQNYLSPKDYFKNYLKSVGKTQKLLTEEKGSKYVRELKQAYVDVFDNENLYFELAEIQVLEVIAKNEDDEEYKVKIIGNNSYEEALHIVPSDMIASMGYYLNLFDRVGSLDDIDHLSNRRLRLIGELLKNQFRIGLTKMEKNVKDRMSTKDPEEMTPQKLINVRPLTSSLKEFFGSSQLSQFMAQTNPIDELTHKRRISALGPGGLTRDRAGFEVRDVHHSHYGRICPIETPEGQNIGLINSLASYVRVNKYGFMETPYLKIEHTDDGAKVIRELVYLAADEEEQYVIAQGNAQVNDDNFLEDESIVARYQGETKMHPRSSIELMDVSPKQIVSISTACIPFLEHDDANRALMGANMQRQAIPLLIPEAPFVGTGIEYKAAHDSGSAVVSINGGTVEYVDAEMIKIREEDDTLRPYQLAKYERSNQGTCINQKPIVKLGEKVEADQTITDGPSMDEGEMAIGRNVTVAFMTWNGYNYEDAIIMSERLVKDDVYTSIHIEKYEIDARDTKLGKEEITREIPHVSEEGRKYLDEKGIIIPGAEVFEGDILVGKVTPKGVTDPTPEDKLLLAIFGEKSREVRDTSLRVPHGGGGIVQDVKYFSRANGDELNPGVNESVRVYVVQKRKISEGDKMAGRHGNKGVISKILPIEDMPYNEDGEPVDIMLNPLGVPSRMNIGQVLELHLGMAAKKLGTHVATPVFDGANNDDIAEIMQEANMRPDGKSTLYSGQTGKKYDNPISVGIMYMIKLDHMVDDKLHARSVGPYTLVTQQPMGGKAQNGGQRFGEMEVWALEAYGAAYCLQEMLTVKSDDIIGRNKVFRSIVDGKPIPDPSLPESFRVLTRELQSLGIYVELINRKTGENEANKSLVDEDAEDYISKYGFQS